MKRILPVVCMLSIFVFVYTSSIMLADVFDRAGARAFENPDDPFNVLYFIAILLILTLTILAIAKLWNKQIIHVFILFAIAATTFSILSPIMSLSFSEPIPTTISVIGSLVIVLLLIYYPEWYVIDSSAIVLSIGAISIFGISLSVPLVLLLLSILAVYDAISVYKTKHMIDLADTVVELKLPVLFVIPKKLPYSFRKARGGIKKQIKRKEREAFFMGVGDVVIPGILVVSCYYFSNSLAISTSVAAGIILGFLLLMAFVAKGKAHAGLPFLNGGAILGYVLSSYILYGKLVGFSI